MMMLSTLSSVYHVNVQEAASNDIVRTKDGWYFSREENQLDGPFDTERGAREALKRYWNGEQASD